MPDIFHEKAENCPDCGESGEAWLYDFQVCKSCGHGSALYQLGKSRPVDEMFPRTRKTIAKVLHDIIRQEALSMREMAREALPLVTERGAEHEATFLRNIIAAVDTFEEAEKAEEDE